MGPVWARLRRGARALRRMAGRFQRIAADRLGRRRGRGALYADDVVRLDAAGLRIRRYYWPFGARRIAYDEIRGYTTRPLTVGRGQYRVHGIDLGGRWYHHDVDRSNKPLAIVLDVGGRLRPVVTPSSPNDVLEILDDRVGARGDR